MTLEMQVSKINQNVNKMIDTVVSEVSKIDRLYAYAPFDYLISTLIPESETSSQSFAGIMQKIAARRAAEAGPEPTSDFDELSYPRPITVHVDSFTDMFPITITTPNVEIVFRRHVVLKIPSGTVGIKIATRDVTITGGVFAFKSQDPNNTAVEAASDSRNEVRLAKLYNTKGQNLKNIRFRSFNEEI